jgi:hypothetical protein
MKKHLLFLFISCLALNFQSAFAMERSPGRVAEIAASQKAKLVALQEEGRKYQAKWSALYRDTDSAAYEALTPELQAGIAHAQIWSKNHNDNNFTAPNIEFNTINYFNPNESEEYDARFEAVEKNYGENFNQESLKKESQPSTSYPSKPLEYPQIFIAHPNFENIPLELPQSHYQNNTILLEERLKSFCRN